MKKIFTLLFSVLFSVFCVAQSPIINKHFPSMHHGEILDVEHWGEKYWMIITSNSSPSFKKSDIRLYKLTLNGDEVWSKTIDSVNIWMQPFNYGLPLKDGRVILKYTNTFASCTTKERLLMLDSVGQVLIDYSNKNWAKAHNNLLVLSNQQREIAILDTGNTRLNILRIGINDGKLIKSTLLDFDSLPVIKYFFSSESDSNRFFLANDQAIYVIENGTVVNEFPLQRSALHYSARALRKIPNLDKFVHCSHRDNSIAILSVYDKNEKTDSIICHTHQFIADVNEKEVLTVGHGSKIYSLETNTMVDSFRLSDAPIPYSSVDYYNNYRIIGENLLQAGVWFYGTRRAIVITVDRTTKWLTTENDISLTSFHSRAEDILGKWVSKVPTIGNVYFKNATIGVQNNSPDTLKSFYASIIAYKNSVKSADLAAPCIIDSTAYKVFENLSIPPGGIFTFDTGPFWMPIFSLDEPHIYVEVGAPNGKPDVYPSDNFKPFKLDFDMIPYPDTFLYWPNPVRDELTITVPFQNLFGISFEVYSVNGTQIFSGILHPDDEDYYHFDTSYLGAGIFFFRAGKDRGRFVKM